MPRTTTQPPSFSQFKARSAKTRKSCTWCGSRVSTGITVHRGEHIAGLCCYNCYADLTAWLSQELQKALAVLKNDQQPKSGEGTNATTYE
jgi:hypothetical protein